MTKRVRKTVRSLVRRGIRVYMLRRSLSFMIFLLCERRFVCIPVLD